MMTEAIVFLVGGASSMGLLYGNQKLRQKLRKKHRVADGQSANVVRKKSKEEKEAIKYLRGNVGSLAFFVVSSFYPVARLPAIVLAVYACVPIYKRAYPAVISLFKERKITNDRKNTKTAGGFPVLSVQLD